MKKKLEEMAEGECVEDEAGGGEHQEMHPDDDDDDVIGPPLPPGFKVSGLLKRNRQ